MHKQWLIVPISKCALKFFVHHSTKFLELFFPQRYIDGKPPLYASSKHLVPSESPSEQIRWEILERMPVCYYNNHPNSLDFLRVHSMGVTLTHG